MNDDPRGARPDLSVIIPARNAAATLRDQLDALLFEQRWEKPWEIVLVDNLSTDATGEIAEHAMRLDPRLRIVEASEQPGLSYARNVGISRARSDNIAICDADDVVGGGWVAAMGDALRRHPVVTGPLELDLLNPPWLAGSRGRVSEGQLSMFFGIFPKVSGGNMGLRREAWERVGGFEGETVGADDRLFSLRLWQQGIPVHFEPRAIVHYRYRTSARDLWKQGRAYGAARPLICRRVAEGGARPPGRLSGWRSWLWLVAHLPKLVKREGRAAWIWVAANRLGQAEGCIRHRALYL